MSPARRIWEQGQQALRLGQPDKAISCYKQSLALDPRFAQAHLSLAAVHLEIGDEVGACPHLARYVEARPDQVMVRGHYAELLFRLKQVPEARAQFERYVIDAQDESGPAANNLLHCHSRLMEIGELIEDEYLEHLHRGIGLLLLARARADLSDIGHDPTQEALLCKAAGELTLALHERPDEAQPCWYLYQVWTALAQHMPAARWLRQADAAAPFSFLTPAEHRSLRLAMAEDLGSFPRR
jgi:tetratricopeptide (TPR) repeat protein